MPFISKFLIINLVLLGHPTITVSEGASSQIIATIQATDPDGMSDGSVIYDFTHPVRSILLITIIMLLSVIRKLYY